MGKLPVTVVTGFLGAGKTTLIRHLLTHSKGRRLAVLVNEFGEIGIDGELLRGCQICDDEPAAAGGNDAAYSPDRDLAPSANIVELSNGCLCCTVQEEFLPTMQVLLRRGDLDAVIIETSGLALPQPLVRAFRWPEIRTQATVDGVITVVDAEAIAAGGVVQDLAALEAQRQADPNLDHESSIDELFADQLACADLVLLTKLDCLDPATQAKVEAQLSQRLPAGVSIIPCRQGKISPQVLLGLEAEVETHVEARRGHHEHDHDTHSHDTHGHDAHDHAHDHAHDDRITAIQVTLDQPIEPDHLIEQLKALGQVYDLYRVKGFVNVPRKPMRLVLQGVGPRFDTFYDRLWHPEELRQTRLVLIGDRLDQADIQAALSRELSLR